MAGKPGLVSSWIHNIQVPYMSSTIYLIATDQLLTSYGGRFSNGPIWAEYVAKNLSIPLYDYAVGGASISNDLVQGFIGSKSNIPVFSVLDQVASFLEGMTPQNTAFSGDDDLAVVTPLFFFFFAGLNDILFNSNISAL